MSLAADNASVMQGRLKSVASFVVKKAPHVYMLGCACHLMHLAAGKAAAALDVRVDELLIDIYYYLDKSSKRKQELKRLQVLCDVETHKILKHVSVRWLSIGVCLDRLIEQWPALTALFVHSSDSGSSGTTKKSQTGTVSSDRHSEHASKSSTTGKPAEGRKPCDNGKERPKTGSTVSSNASGQTDETGAETGQFDLTRFLFKEKEVARKAVEAKKSKPADCSTVKMSGLETREKRISRLLSDPYTKLNCLFLSSSIQVFDSVNLLLQKDEPCIYMLHDVLVDAFQKILVKFVLPSCITKASRITEVDF
jgi:hypothetical protein